MTDRELKRLSRLELLDMLVSQIQENEDLQKQLNEATEKLRNREIVLSKAGSIAEAALQLNEVFSAADKAAAQYLENIKMISDDQNAVCDKIIADAQKKADEIIKQAEEAARARIIQADAFGAAVLEQQKDDVNEEVGADDSAVSEEEGT